MAPMACTVQACERHEGLHQVACSTWLLQALLTTQQNLGTGVVQVNCMLCRTQVTLIAQLLCHLRPLARFSPSGRVPADTPELLRRLADMVFRPPAAMATEAGERDFRALVAQLLRPPSPTGKSGMPPMT